MAETDNRTGGGGENRSLQLARFWVRLEEARALIENELVPLGHHLGVAQQDGELMDALEAAGARAASHLGGYRLTAEPKRDAPASS